MGKSSHFSSLFLFFSLPLLPRRGQALSLARDSFSPLFFDPRRQRPACSRRHRKGTDSRCRALCSSASDCCSHRRCSLSRRFKKKEKSSRTKTLPHLFQNRRNGRKKWRRSSPTTTSRATWGSGSASGIRPGRGCRPR